MTNPELRLTRLIESVDFHEFLFQYSLGMAHKYSFPEYFYNIAAGLEYEFSEIKAKIGVDEALNKLCSVYEDTQKKAHLRVFMRMKLERELEL